MMSITARIVAGATAGEIISGDLNAPVHGVSTDTRTLREGDLFIALTGPNFDGAEFIPEALRKGAAGVAAARLPQGCSIPPDRFFVKVASGEAAFGDLARHWRSSLPARVVAVMGSSGKTSTKEMLALAAGESFDAVTATQFNLNNTIGVPQTVFRMDAGTQIAIIEMGMNMPGEMSRLGKIADPDILVVTHIGRCHIGMFGSQRDLIRAKAEIFDHLRPECILIINGECPRTPEFLSHARHDHRRVVCGMSNSADVFAQDIEPLPEGGYKFLVMLPRKAPYSVRLPVYGRYNIHNALAVFAVMDLLGVSPDKVAQSLAAFVPANMRSEVRSCGEVTFITDCYNANPDSMSQSLISLQDAPCPGRTYVVLGDMLELGDLAESLHREVGTVAASVPIDLVVTCGTSSRWISDEVARAGRKSVHTADHLQAADLLGPMLKPGDRLLIKGSRMMKMENLAAMLMESLKKQNSVQDGGRKCSTCL